MRSGAPDPNLLQLVIHLIQYLKFSLQRQSLHSPLTDQIPCPNALVALFSTFFAVFFLPAHGSAILVTTVLLLVHLHITRLGIIPDTLD